MKMLAVAVTALLLAGCARYEYTPSADGRGSYTITCPARRLGICFAKAAEICHSRPYEVLSTRRPGSGPFFLIWRDEIVVRCL
jgi:hypothetical protein